MLTARSGPAEGDLAARLLARSAPPAEAGDAATQPFARPATPAAAESAPPLPMPSPGGQRGGFDQAVGDRVLWMARNGISHAEIRVRPEHLGPIEARLSMEGDRVQLQLSAPSAVTREVLEQALPRLRGMFEEAGLQLGDAGVGEGGDGGAAGQTDAERADEGGESGNGASGGGEPGGGEPGGDEAGQWHGVPSSNRHLLDVFA